MEPEVGQPSEPRKTQWHFKILQPIIKPDDDFGEDLRYSLRKISKLVALAEHEVVTENSRSAVRVLFSYPSYGFQKPRLSSLRSDFGMMSEASDGGRRYLNCLTKQSVLGIEPLSAVFKTYWTASFFNQILADGPRQMNSLIRETLQEASPYIAPTVVVFGFVTLGGLYHGFHLMQHLYNIPPTSMPDLDRILGNVLPTIELLFKFFTRPENSEAKSTSSHRNELKELRSDHNLCLDDFKTQYDNVLGDFQHFKASTNGETLIRDSEWMFQVCDHLYEMSIAASTLLRGREPLLKAVVDARTQEIKKGMSSTVQAVAAGTAASMAGFGAATVAITAETIAAAAVPAAPVILFGGLAAKFVFEAYNSFGSYRELGKESERLLKMFAAANLAWDNAYKIHVLLQRYRLDFQAASTLSFSDEQIEQRLRVIINEYQNVTRNQRNRGLSEVLLLAIFIEQQVDLMKKQRNLLN
ncbi:Fc.00g071500.m01.CDS01 [Cosmosporella sp. VM-42]